MPGMTLTGDRGAVSTGRRNMSQVLADELIRRVDDGQFPVGSRAPTERELMEMFEVGRSTAREAVRILVAAGMLDVRPGRGPVVLRTSATSTHLDPRALTAQLADQSLTHLYEFRLCVETECAALSASRATAQDVVELGRLLAEFREAVKTNTTTHQLDVEFHLAVARASHNDVYPAVLEAVNEPLRNARAMTDAVSGAREVAVLGHTEIYEAIRARDVERSRATMTSHILAGLAALEHAHGIDVYWPGRPEQG